MTAVGQPGASGELAPDAAQLELRGVSVAFAGVPALSDVNLSVRRGEILGLIGPNGAGKTTLVNVASGFQRADHGTVLLGGEDITRLGPAERTRRGLARTFQAVRLFGRLTAKENVEAAALGMGVSRREARRRAHDLLAELDIDGYADVPAAALPYGEERRLALARAAATEAAFLLLDEPAAGLDEREGHQLIDVIANIRQRTNCGIVMIEHDMPLLMGVSDRVHVLAHGATIAEGTPAEVQKNPEVVEAYLGRAAAA